LRSNFSVLLFSTFFGDVVTAIFVLYLPLFAYQLGANVFELGLVGGVAYASYSFVPVVIGRYSDQVRRRKDFMVISLAMLAACSFVYAFVDSPIQLISLRVLEGVAWAILWPIIDAEVSEDVSRESSKSLSIYNTVWSTAGALGPLLGVALIILLTEIRYIFFATALMMVLSTVVSAMFIRDDKAAVSKLVSDSSPEASAPKPKSAGGNSIWIFVVAMVFQSAIRGVLFTFYPPLAESRGISYLLIGVIGFSFYAARAGVFSFTTRDDFRGFFLKRENAKRTLIISVVVSAAAGSLPLFNDSAWIVGVVAFAIVALASSFTVMISQVELITRAEANRKGSGAGVFESTIGIGVALGPVVAGFISGGSLSIPFLVSPVGFVIALPIMLLLSRHHNAS
jgi:MFS family permease